MLTDDESRSLQGAEVYDDADSKIGTVGQVWADTTGKPSWVSINTGLFGHNETLMPLLGAYVADGVLRTPYAKNLVVAAPNVDVNAEQPLDSDGLSALYAHYTLTLDTSSADSPDDSEDDAMIRSEERLTVGMEQQVTGKVRLRKHVVTEYVTTTVPVRHEEVRLEHVPLDEADIDTTDAGVHDAAVEEAEHEIILYAERPVVTTEKVAVERVRIGKQSVTEQETVGGEVRKERIEFDQTEHRGAAD